MRTLQRNKQEIWYALYEGVADVIDSDGNYTGEQEVRYTEPVKTRMNVSGGKGKAMIEEFGTENPFTHTAVTDDLSVPFTTDSIFWFRKTPTDGPHNFRCTGVLRTINGLTLALAEVEVTEDAVVSA